MTAPSLGKPRQTESLWNISGERLPPSSLPSRCGLLMLRSPAPLEMWMKPTASSLPSHWDAAKAMQKVKVYEYSVVFWPCQRGVSGRQRKEGSRSKPWTSWWCRLAWPEHFDPPPSSCVHPPAEKILIPRNQECGTISSHMISRWQPLLFQKYIWKKREIRHKIVFLSFLSFSICIFEMWFVILEKQKSWSNENK